MKKYLAFFSILFLVQVNLLAQKNNQVQITELIEKLVLADEYTSIYYEGFDIILYDFSRPEEIYNLELSKFLKKRFTDTKYYNKETGKIKIRAGLMLVECDFLMHLMFNDLEFYGSVMLDGVSLNQGMSITNCDFFNDVGFKIDSIKGYQDEGPFVFEPTKTRIELWNCTFNTPTNFYIRGDYDLSVVNSTLLAPSFYISGNSTVVFFDNVFSPFDPNDAYDEYLVPEEKDIASQIAWDTTKAIRYGRSYEASTYNLKLNQVAGNVDLYIDSTDFFTKPGFSTISEITGDFGDVFIMNSVFNGALILNESVFKNKLIMKENTFNHHVSFSGVIFPELYMDIPWVQLSESTIANYVYVEERDAILKEVAQYYPYLAQNKFELDDKNIFYGLIRAYNNILTAYKDNGELEYYNACYSEMKDIQGSLYKNEFLNDGQFRSYFKWKLNRLLKLYTNHGTDPALAIVITIYVILFFAIFYFIFPSEWDQKSKSRLFSDFKTLIRQNDKGYIKPFFSLFFGLLYSLVNAITLSLNAFVTLGFGNIPTRGIARFMCVFQGFIGWFLLSIFTVALINQVLF